MIFGLNDDQQALRASVRNLVERHAPVTRSRAIAGSETGFDDALWRRAAELGLQGLLVPERFDGADAGAVEMTIAMEEFGRTLCGPSLLMSTVATKLLTASGDEEIAARYLPALAAGSLIATAAVGGGLRTNDSDASVTAEKTAAGWSLRGAKYLVLDAGIADLIVISAQADGADALFAVAGDATGLQLTGRSCLDSTRRVCDIAFHDTPAQLIHSEDVPAVIAEALTLGAVLLSAEAVGGAHSCLDTTIGYVKHRAAFGRTIGAFQATKHRCADMYVSVEGSRCAVMHAAWSFDVSDPDARTNAALARAYSAESFVRVTESTIQLHGAIGFTWEHDAHLFLKRARVNRLLFTPESSPAVPTLY